MTDERQGYPSASSLDRIMACPASRQRERGKPNEDIKVSEEGHRVHKALETGDITGLSEHETWLFHRSRTIEEEICRDLGFHQYGVEQSTERRLWLDPSMKRDVNMSGRYDNRRKDMSGRRLLIDYKEGKRQVDAAADNWQMSGYAVLDAIDDPVAAETIVAIIQPQGVPDRSVAKYTPADLKRAGGTIVAGLRAAEEEGAPAHAGKHCHYCKARGECPEALAMTMALIPLDKVEITKVGRKTEVRLPSISPEQLRDGYEMASTINQILDAVKARFKQSVIDGEQPSYEMGRGNTLISLKDMDLFFELLSPHVPIETLSRSMKIGIGEMDKIVGVVLGGVSNEKARAFWLPIAAPSLDSKEGEPVVRKKKL